MTIANIPTSVLAAAAARLNFDPRGLPAATATQPIPDPERIAVRRAIAEAEGGVAQFERILNNNDLLSINYLEKGTRAARSVGRINIVENGGVAGFGTGFLVAPGLLLTNHHVFPSIDSARDSFVEFDFQLNAEGRPAQAEVFDIDVNACFVNDEELDFALVGVQSRSQRGTDVAAFGFLPLNRTPGKTLDAEFLTIIQHPSGDLKQIAARENKLVKTLDSGFLWYITDTAPGSSGSPVFNDSWQVVGLHHSGVPETRNGRIVAVNGQDWTPAMGEGMIKWIANEGVRISSILESLERNHAANSAVRRLLDSVSGRVVAVVPIRQEDAGGLPVQVPAPVPVANVSDAAPPDAAPPLQAAPGSGGVLTVEGGGFKLTLTTEGGASQAALPSDLFERISIDPNYSSRRGYDPSFLGGGNRRIELPKLDAALLRDAALKIRDDGHPRHVLPYHHYSAILNAKRRLAFVTAVNIDGTLSRKLKRADDEWIFDPRIPKEAQIGNDLYKRNDLDRGHLVRRLDPAWGETREVAQLANDDTFHYTNCSPQHKDFNQSEATWQGLEDYILDNSDNRDLKVTVFNGPVFGDNDREYRGVRIPLQYWKVVAMVKDDGRLSATAYLLSQADLIDDLPREAMVREGFVFGKYKTFQVAISKVERLTKLDFGNLRNFDPLARNRRADDSRESSGYVGSPVRMIESARQIVL